MVREIKEVLKVLGWGDGFKIPIANEENKELERQVEELLKKKAVAIVKLEAMNEQEDVMTKHKKIMDDEKTYNQKLLNGLQKQLDDEINSLRIKDCENNNLASEIKTMKKDLSEMSDTIKKLKTDVASQTKKMNSLKESLHWGEDALFAWDEELAKGDKEMGFLRQCKAQDEEKFQKTDLERLQVESDLIEAKALEKREADRYQILEAQLENISKLYKEAYNEKKRLTKVWFDSASIIRSREEDIQRYQDIHSEVKNKTRSKCIELFDQKGFYEEIKNMNETVKKEINYEQDQYGKLNESIVELESVNKYYKNEVDLRNRSSGSMSAKLDNQRRKNGELTEKNKIRLKKYNKLLEENIRLQEQCDLLKADSMSREQKYKNAENMYELSSKASIEDTRELERLQALIVQLKNEINKLKEKEVLKKKEFSYATRKEQELVTMLKSQDIKYQELEGNIENLVIEESILVAKIIEYQNKFSKEEKEELEKEITELNLKESSLMKDENKIHQRIKTIQREYKDFIKMLRTGEDEITKLEEKIRSLKRSHDFEKKDNEKTKEDINKMRLQLNLLMMRESNSEETIARNDVTVSKLERQRIILEAAMKERKLEINAQQEILLGKKRSLTEEKSLLRKTVEHLNLRIKQIQSRYTVSMDLLGKDETGHTLSVAHFKIKLAQEKFELQQEGDELEAKVNKVEKEIQAMENTLKLLTSANENFKISLGTIDSDDPDMIEKERIESKFMEVKRLINEDTIFINCVRREVEELMREITSVKKFAKELEEDWKLKEKEVTFLEKELADKQIKLNRATQLLRKTMKDVMKCKEPVPYKQLAQKEINIRMLEERNKSVLQQLAEFATNYIETKPIVSRYTSEHSLKLPQGREASIKAQSLTHSLNIGGGDTSRSRASARSDSSTSVVNLDPNELLKHIPTCLNKPK